MSENHDLFMDLIAGDPSALHRVIYSHTRTARRRPLMPGKELLPGAEIIEENARFLAAQLAAVRIVNARNNMELDFTRFSFGGLKVHEFEVESIAKIVCTRSAAAYGTHDVVVKEAQAVEQEIRGLFSAVGDHDLFQAISRRLVFFREVKPKSGRHADKTQPNSWRVEGLHFEISRKTPPI